MTEIQKEDINAKSEEIDHTNDKIPFPKLLIMGLQHVLVMYAGSIAVPLIIGSALYLTKEQTAFLIKADLFTCGIATLLQSFGIGKNIGIKLPVILGVSFITVAPMINIGQHLGMQYIYGAIIISGLIVFLISDMFCKLLKFFPTIVVGIILTVIGIILLPVAINWSAGGAGAKEYGSFFNLSLALGVMIVIIVITKFGNPFFKSIAVLCGLVLGSVFAFFAGHMSVAGISNEPAFGMVAPFWFGVPKFNISAIAIMTLVAFINMIESSGVFFAVGKITGKKIGHREVAAGFKVEGLAMIIGSVLNSFPYATFAQNVGLVVMTQVKSRFVAVAAGFILIILGLFPKLAFLIASMPPAVLGGAGIIMFGLVAATGLSMLSEIDYCRTENLIIIASSMGLGIGVSMKPQIFDNCPRILEVILSDGVFMASISAIVLNHFLNYKRFTR